VYTRNTPHGWALVFIAADTLRRASDAETIWIISAPEASRREWAAHAPIGKEPKRLIAIRIDPRVLEAFRDWLRASSGVRGTLL